MCNIEITKDSKINAFNLNVNMLSLLIDICVIKKTVINFKTLDYVPSVILG